MIPLRRWAILAVIVLLTHPSAVLSQGRPAGVGVQVVEERELVETIPVFAEVVTARDGAVASRIAGSVEKVHVLAGSRVAAGDLLVELNEELLEILVAQSEAQLSEAQAGRDTAAVRIDRAEISFARIEALRDSGSFSKGQFDDARADLLEAQSQQAEAEARVKSSRAQLSETLYKLERSKIRAPFPGVIVEVNTIPGAFIQAGSPVVRLLDIEAFEVQASVPARYVADLEPGQEVSATLETGEVVTLNLRSILPLENTSTRTRPVRFASSDLGELNNVAVGQSLTVDIPLGAARTALTVPKDALIQGRNGWTVFVAEENKAQPRPVQLGTPMGDRYEVLNGLLDGDLVVVRGNERLRPGQDITPNPVEAN